MSLLNKIGGLFGLGGGQGDYYQAPALASKAKDKLDAALDAGSNKNVQDIIGKLGIGGASLADVLDAAKASGNQEAALQNIAASPLGGSALASEQVREDPTLGALFGDGGSMDQAINEESRLVNQGYSLQPEDYEAYGQGAGNIARTFGKQEQSLAQALASRGLSAGNSGASNAQFSGLMGNKFEQLGQLQRQIADDRMKNTMERVNQTRSYLSSLGGLNNQAQNQRFNQNQTANEQQQNEYNSDINKYNSEQSAAQASQKSKEANREVGLEDAIGSGIYSGISGGIGGIGAMGADQLGGSIFNAKKGYVAQAKGKQ